MRVKSLHIYPVKALHAIEVNEALVETQGLSHDRRWMLIDANGRFISQREHPKLTRVKVRVMPDGLFFSVPEQQDIFIATPKENSPVLSTMLWKQGVQSFEAEQSAHQWFSSFLGAECRLVYQRNGEGASSFADSAPILVSTMASLSDLNSRMETPLPMNRFRPNIVIDGGVPWMEDGWQGLRIGEVELEVIKPCTRCVVTTIDQETGEKTGKEPIATLTGFRLMREPGLTGVIFGQYALSRKGGMLRPGDKVEVLTVKEAPQFIRR